MPPPLITIRISHSHAYFHMGKRQHSPNFSTLALEKRLTTWQMSTEVSSVLLPYLFSSHRQLRLGEAVMIQINSQEKTQPDFRAKQLFFFSPTVSAGSYFTKKVFLSRKGNVGCGRKPALSHCLGVWDACSPGKCVNLMLSAKLAVVWQTPWRPSELLRSIRSPVSLTDSLDCSSPRPLPPGK